jgi:hypothetical protein
MQRLTWLSERTTLLLILQKEDAVRVVIRKSLLKVCSLQKLALFLPAGKGAKISATPDQQ